MTSHRRQATSKEGTPVCPLLQQALGHNVHVKVTVDDAALALSWVTSSLKAEYENGAPRANVQEALGKSQNVELLLQEAAKELASINAELTKEITERDHLEHHVRQVESALRVSQSEARMTKAAEEEARHRAFHDPLTELPNLNLFSDLIEQALEQADRHAWRLAVLFLDLDGFKEINDTHGHDIGDRVLQEVAMRLRQTVRGADSVARRCGDEFLILALEVQDDDTIVVLANKLCVRLGEPMDIEGINVTVSASVGIAIYPDDAMSAAGLLKAADSAMYSAKRQKAGVMRHAPQAAVRPGPTQRPDAAEQRQSTCQLSTCGTAPPTEGKRNHTPAYLSAPSGWTCCAVQVENGVLACPQAEPPCGEAPHSFAPGGSYELV